MGVCIETKNFSTFMSYGAFGRLRNRMVELCMPERAEMISRIYYGHASDSDYDRLNDILANGSKDVERFVRFVLKPDCDGKANRKACKSISKLMSECKEKWQYDTELFGYVGHGREACVNIAGFMEMIEDGAKNKGLKWT